VTNPLERPSPPSENLIRRLSTGRGRMAVHLATLMGATGMALVWSYRIWNLHPRRPLIYGGDELSGLGNVETIDLTGWWTTNNQWGWPYGLKHYDFPLGGEHLHILTIRFLGLFSDNPVLILNAFYFGTFFAIAAGCFLVLRRLRISPAVAGVSSLLFTFLPFHFWHGTPHFYRTGYYLIPAGGLVLLWLADYDGGFFDGRKVRRKRVGLAIGVSVLLAMSDTVAVAFPLVLAMVLAMVALLSGRGWRTLAVTFGLAFVMATTLVANNLPTFLYQADNGANPITLQREVSEQERYGLKVASLVSPQSDHPIAALAEFGKRTHDDSLLRSEGGQSLGTAGTIGLVAAVVALFGAALGTRRGGADESDSEADENRLLRLCGVFVLSAIVFGVPSGLAFILGMIGLEEFRTWNRIVIYIAFFSLVAFSVMLDRLRRFAEHSGVAPRLVILGLIVIASIGVWDQTPRTQVDYDGAADLYNADAAFFSQVEAQYPDGGQIFALPVIPYPEPQLSEAAGAYRHMIAIIHTSRLDTSYGGIKGREWEWQRELARLPADLAVKALRSAGFDGIYIDRWNYVDGGAKAENALNVVIGSPPSIDTANRSFAFWDLRPLDIDLSVEEQKTLGEEIIQPVVAMLGEGFYGKPRSNALATFAGESAHLSIRNMAQESYEVVVTIETRTAGGEVTIVGPGEWGITSADNVTTARAVVLVPPGDTPIEIRTDGPAYQDAGDPREIHMTVSVSVTGVLVDALRKSDSSRQMFPAFSK